MSPPAPAGRCPRAWALLLLLAAAFLAADLASKHLAFDRVARRPVALDRAEVLATDRLADLIPHHEPVTVVPHALELTLVLNEGAVFGMAAGQRWFFIAFTILAMAFCLWMFAAWTGRRDRLAHAAIALVVAGGLGNLYDRLRFACVRDFLHFLPGVRLPFGLAWPGGQREIWPYVSNIADAQLIAGIAVLMWFSLRPPSTTHTPTDNEPPTREAA